MRFAGRVEKAGTWWAVQVPLLGAYSQGRTKRKALIGVRSAIEEMVNERGFHVDIYLGKAGHFEVGCANEARLVAFFLRQQRGRSGRTLKEVAERLGQRSVNAYARYEQGASMPTMEKLTKLLKAAQPDLDFVLQESGARVPLR